MCIYIYIHISTSSICLRKWKVRRIKLTEASIKKDGSGKVYVKVFCTVLAHFLVLKIISKMKKFQQYSSYNVSFFVSSPDTPALSSGLLRLRTSPIICFPGSTLSGPLFPLSQILSFVSSAYVMCHIFKTSDSTHYFWKTSSVLLGGLLAPFRFNSSFSICSQSLMPAANTVCPSRPGCIVVTGPNLRGLKQL